MRLDTLQNRRKSLAAHLDHKNWHIPGPFISFTTSQTRIEDLARMRLDRRGSQTLTVIDPRRRINNGLPVLDVEAEMEFYSIPNPYGKGNEYYIDHYVCLWEVTEDEIVGNWSWDDLKDDAGWYENIIMPAFRAFTEIPTPPSSVEPHITMPAPESMNDLLSNFKELSGMLHILE